MSGASPQKQLLTLIRDFASEKSQGERRVAGLKKQIEQLQSAIDRSNAEVEEAKHSKETVEQELRGCEVELALSQSASQALQARISTIHAEIAAARSDVEDLKDKGRKSRDEFIKKMFEFNARIRKYRQRVIFNSKEDSMGNSSGESLYLNDEVNGIADKSLEDELAGLITQTNKEEAVFQMELNVQKQMQQELLDLEKKLLLMRAIMKVTRDLQDMTRQSSQLEHDYSELALELQRRSICPSCHRDNIEALGGILHITDPD